MADKRETQIQKLHNHHETNTPSSFLRVYHRRKLPKQQSPSLPEELVIEILKRLPVSSLLRFMRVSKSWYSLITNPSFISSHLSHQCNPISKYHRITTSLYSFPCQFYLHNVDEDLDNWVKIESPVGPSCLIVGCCDGVVCLFDYWSLKRSSVVLWNPSIRKAYNLPLPVPPFQVWVSRAVVGDGNTPKFTLGFGFDHISKDYKVVRVFCYWEVENISACLHADVCSLSSKGGWRQVVFPVEGDKFDIERRGVYVNGAIHWMCKKRVDDNVFVKTVLSFDLGKEEFGQILLPSPLSSAVLLSVKLDEDKLAVSSKGDGSNVWVMEEYGKAKSWRKLLNFYIGEGVGTILGAAVAGDGKIVVTTSVGNWISWDPINQKLMNLTLPILEPYYVYTFVKSLVLLRFRNRALCCQEIPLKKKALKRITAHEHSNYIDMLRHIRSEDYRN